MSEYQSQSLSVCVFIRVQKEQRNAILQLKHLYGCNNTVFFYESINLYVIFRGTTPDEIPSNMNETGPRDYDIMVAKKECKRHFET